MKNSIESGTLYIVPTPIGNMEDITLRAKKVLEGVVFVAAEDTRVGGRLLELLGIRKTLLPYHEHNKNRSGAAIAERLAGGQSCALITDAGTPAVSDPGQELVRLCALEGINVVPLPGACAAVCALSASGLKSARFAFEGFLPAGGSERRKRLEAVSREERTLIFYIAPHDLRRDLADLYAALGERSAAVCRELTKLNEEIVRAPLSSLAECGIAERGEFVLVVEGAPDRSESWDGLDIVGHYEMYLDQGMPPMDAVKAVAADRKLPKSEVYKHVKKK